MILLFRISSAAAHNFAEDRQSGALELLLSTPLSARQILRGQWLALLRQMWGPMCAVALVHGLFVWGLVELFAADVLRGRGASALDVLKAIQKYGLRGHDVVDWHFIFMLMVVLSAGVLLFTDWIALGWVGMWMGIKAKRARNAPWAALALVLIPPWPVFTLGIVVLIHFDFLWSEFETLYLGLGMAVGLGLLNNLLLSIWAWWRLRRDFRVAVTDRYLFSHRNRSWAQRKKIALRFAAAAAAMFLLIKLWHAEENWRGQRAWSNFQREIKSKSENLDLASMISPAVPSDQNFGAAPIFAPLFAYMRTPRGSIEWRQRDGYAKLEAINIERQSGRYWTTPNNKMGDWQSQVTVELKPWQKYFRNLTQFPKSATTNDPAADVLLALTRFDLELESVQAASRLPHSQFPIDYDKRRIPMDEHLAVVQNIVEVLELRALASLNLGRSQDALRDLEVIFRFGEALRHEPFLPSYQTRTALLNSAIQIVWEGLAICRWSDDQIALLEERLNALLLPADFARALRGDMIQQIDAWERFRSVLSGDPQAENVFGEKRWLLLKFLYPAGRTFHSQIKTYHAYQQLLRAFLDAERGKISPERAQEAWDALEKNGAVPSNRGYWYNLESAAYEFHRTRASLNLARTACALERYRVAHAQYPERLELLVPVYLDELPRSGTNYEPMQFQRTHDGEFVLSIFWKNLNWRSATAERLMWAYPTD